MSFLVQKLFRTIALAWKAVVPEAQFSVIGIQENEIIASNVDTSSTNLRRCYHENTFNYITEVLL